MTRSLLEVPPAAVETLEDAEACCAPVFDGPPALQPEEAARYAAVLKALADPHRLRMLSIIAAQSAAEPLCVCEIEGEFGLAQPTISHHLKVLRAAGRRRQDGPAAGLGQRRLAPEQGSPRLDRRPQPAGARHGKRRAARALPAARQ